MIPSKQEIRLKILNYLEMRIKVKNSELCDRYDYEAIVWESKRWKREWENLCEMASQVCNLINWGSTKIQNKPPLNCSRQRISILQKAAMAIKHQSWILAQHMICIPKVRLVWEKKGFWTFTLISMKPTNDKSLPKEKFRLNTNRRSADRLH